MILLDLNMKSAYRHNGIIERMLQYQTRIISPIDARIRIA